MKKVILAIVILVANGVLISCTELEENLESEPTQFEASATGGEEEQDPDDGDDDDDISNSGGGN